jgi:hypothetical protein
MPRAADPAGSPEKTEIVLAYPQPVASSLHYLWQMKLGFLKKWPQRKAAATQSAVISSGRGLGLSGHVGGRGRFGQREPAGRSLNNHSFSFR